MLSWNESKEKFYFNPLSNVKETMISGHQEGIRLKEVADLTRKEPSTLQSIIKTWKDTGCEENMWPTGRS